MKTIIDLDTWNRRENWQFFKDFINPMASITCQVECRGAYRLAKETHRSFFLIYLHAILRAINETEAFRYRVDPDGNIVLYDRIDVLSPIKIQGRDGFVTMRFPYIADRDEFITRAREIIDNPGNSSAYSTENSQTEHNLVLVSAVPFLPFTATEFTQRSHDGNPYPLIVVGKMDTNNGKMPVAISFHHGFVDGEHVGNFYSLLNRYLENDW